MDNYKYEIIGGKPIKGEIICYGAKNFATKAIVASLLTTEKTILTNVPDIGDIDITLDMITQLGVKFNFDRERGILEIDPSEISTSSILIPDSGSNRIPVLLLNPLLHRFGQARVPIVGGCKIGARQVDFHLKAIEDFGAKIEFDEEGYTAKSTTRLKATHIDLPYPSVGATETCLFLSVLADGTSIINNAALEPEIIELITMLRSMGAIIFTTSGRTIRIDGVKKLIGSVTKTLGDRIEAASWASLACATNGDLTVNGIKPDSLGNFLSHYMQIGGGFEILDSEKLRFYRKTKLKSAMVETDVYPGFSTDWQQPFAVLLTQAEGVSIIHETVFENRFGYLDALNSLGANTQVSSYCLGSLPCRYKDREHNHSAIITGPTKLVSSDTILNVPDLRAGLAYVIVAAVAEGKTTVTGIDYIERGYGDLSVRLKNILEIKKIKC
jgi:UDP-N-acetylglucosamine 1-carboxyvinyltransferase